MTRILTHGNYGVFVLSERGHRHHLPHAHVKLRGQRVASVYILTLEVFDQVERLPAGLLEHVYERQEELVTAWEELNGG
ncbi:MAG: hypothetical protein JWM27_154 [Gemmatimonadetes bacterium]|nr:hypothetical protein [Gemmatimonadota bacterium]